jgi:alkyl sulfatase BDS1-like metallo-beta-lactamase superfamily hydrolase
VFADTANTEARNLAADAFEQLGYQAESATWRNAYLLGAQELRNTIAPTRRPSPGVGPDVLHAMPLSLVFEYLGTRINGPRAGAAHIIINWRFTDTQESLVSNLGHGALTTTLARTEPDANATVTLTRPDLEAVVLGQRTLASAMQSGAVTVSGDAGQLTRLFSFLDAFDAAFPVIEPRR